MLVCDLHCDLPDRVIDGAEIFSNNCHWAEDRLKKENVYVQVFASYVDKYKFDDPFDRVNSMIIKFKESLKNTNIGLVCDYKSLEKNICEGKNSAILSVEGAEALGGRLERIEYFYNLGVRFITLTWNHENQLGYSSNDCSGNGHLTDFGKAAVKEMNRLNITPDVSHLSEKCFWDVTEVSKKPIVATHSNSKVLCNHVRNLTDEQFVAIKNMGGLVGVSYVPDFLEKEGKSDLNSVIRHIEHFMALGGEDTVCLGGDFDGVDMLPEGISGVQDVGKIAENLAKLNYSNEIIAKITGKNIENYIKSAF